MRKNLPGQNGPTLIEEPVARQTVHWCDRSIEWTAIPTDQTPGNHGPGATWRYSLGGLSFIGFPFDPLESASTTRLRALNWLNRHHLLGRRESAAVAANEPAASPETAD